MSAGQAEDDDKQYEPTQKKLDDARKKGDLPKSNDLITAGAYAGLLIAAMTLGPVALKGMGTTLAGLLDQADRLSDDSFNGGGGRFAGALIGDMARHSLAIFAPPFLLALLMVLGQRSLVFAPSKLAPKLSRISLIENAKQKFGRSGLFEFAKSTTKLTIYSTILFIYLWGQLPRMLGAMQLSPAMMVVELLKIVVGLLGMVLAVSLTLALIDMVFQRAEHARKNRMSRKELMDELKESEGDPMMKQQRREKAVSIATNQMLRDVPEAAVVIVNPTHFAVALKWDPSAPHAPICVAKGVDLVAARIREIAQENAVPIHSDPPTARALHATVEIGEEIRPDHYAAVAAAIRFADMLRAKARKA
ncbi:MAG: flagellar biosynthetic protein FlhB [Rhodobacteraceae bacterium HLUCCA08]|nr:MAG: flagellar biosynthetic protein FlhB [Rhodobacteraceae bacterium HLUCCA08]